MNWMKKVAVALVCLLPLGLQAAKVDTLQVKSPSMNKSIEVVVVSPDMAATEPFRWAKATRRFWPIICLV